MDSVPTSEGSGCAYNLQSLSSRAAGCQPGKGGQGSDGKGQVRPLVTSRETTEGKIRKKAHTYTKTATTMSTLHPSSQDLETNSTADGKATETLHSSGQLTDSVLPGNVAYACNPCTSGAGAGLGV